MPDKTNKWNEKYMKINDLENIGQARVEIWQRPKPDVGRLQSYLLSS